MKEKSFVMEFFFITLLISFSLPAFSQEATRQEILDFTESYARWFQAKKAEAVRVATENGWPVRIENPDGSIMEIMFLRENGMPEYLITENNNAAITSGTNNLWPGGSMGLSLTGDDMLIGEWDGGGVRTTHREFRVGTGASRVTQRDAPASLSDHSTHVAGTLIAEGETALAHGMAHQADLDAYDWNYDISEMGLAYTNDNLKLSNHSYGIIRGWYQDNSGTWWWYGDITISSTEDYQFGFYGPLAKTWDSLARLCPYYLICKSAGNDRNDDWNGGHWVWSGGSWVWSTASRDPDGGADGYDCIGNRGVAKNLLTVGAVNQIEGGYTQPSDVVMTPFSSWGPTDDGRIKPDIVADGASLYSSIASGDASYDEMGGTSMATPVVTGSLALLQEYHYDLNASYMYADELKALVINTADEAGPADGPDYQFGHGLLNTDGAAALIRRDDSIGSLIRRSYLANGETETYVYYADGNHPIKATICWIDPAHNALTPALNPTTVCLVHDLDLRIISPIGGIYYPWRLNRTSPANPATASDNDVDNVETVYIGDPAPGEYIVQVNHEGSISGQYYALVVSGLQTQRLDNVWTGGGSSDYWYIDANWSLGHDPVESENALIPDGSGFHAIVDVLDGYCYDLEVGGDAILEIHDDSLTLGGDLLLWGELEMDMDPGRLIINGSAYNYTGATLDIQAANCMIWVSGSWRFYGGVNANMTNGIVNFTGTGISYIYSYDDDASFNKLGIYKTGGGYAEHASASIYPLRTNDYLYLHYNSEFRSNTEQPIIIKGYFSKASSATCNLNMGTIVMDGTATSINFDGTGYFNNLTISPTTSITLQDDITVHGNLLIEEGTLIAGNHKIHLQGNWTNTVGDAGFNETGSRVIFDNGDGSSNIDSDENFDTLDIAIFDAVYINSAADSVTCNHFYLTGGAMNVSAGSFTADDLLQSGIYGGWFVSGTGKVNLHQDGGQYVDLFGSLNISGGTMNIYGGADNSYWGYAAANTVTMSGGVLDFVNQGIHIYNNFTLTDNITGGTIRTAKGFRVFRGDFNPSGGTIYFRGSTDDFINHYSGSNLFSITINKLGTDDDASYKPDETLVRDYDGSTEGENTSRNLGLFRKKPDPGQRSNVITLASNLDINGSVLIDNGILDVSTSNFSINCAGNWTDNVELGIGFNERAGTVTFDGAYSSSLHSETFYNLVLNKTYEFTNGLILQDGNIIRVTNNLTVTDGTMEIEPTTILDIWGDLSIATGAGINADDFSAEVRIKGDWTDNNAAISTTAGFYPGYYSTVLFHGEADQYLSSTASTVLFNNITIDKTTSAHFRPYDNLELRGDLNINSGWWWDAATNLTHSFRGDFNILSTGGYSTNMGTDTKFIGSSDQVISWAGSNGYFSDLIIDKSIADDGGRSNMVSLATPIYLLNGPTMYVNYGTLDLNGQYIRATGDVKIGTGGKMAIGGGAWLEVGGGDSLIVYDGGTLEVIGTDGDEALVEGNNDLNYVFEVRNGGTISAEYAIFEEMGINGLYVQSGGLVDVNHDFDFCTFKNGTTGTATLLRIDNNQTITIDSAYFPTSTTTDNVTKTLAQGSVTFVGATGPFAGPVYEDDVHGRIHWAEHGLWEGTVSTDWNTAANWGFDLVPTVSEDVVIPAGCPYYPVMTGTFGVNTSSYSFDCHSLTIEEGGSLTYSSNSSLYNDGTVNVNGMLAIGNDYQGYSGSVLYLESDTVMTGTVSSDGRLNLYSGAVVNQTGGHLLSESWNLNSGCQYNGNGGTAHLYVNGSAQSTQPCYLHDAESYFYNFKIDDGANGSLSISTQDLECNATFEVRGTFNPFGKEVTTTYMDVYGTLNIDSGLIVVEGNGPYFHSPGVLNMTGGSIDAGNTFRWYSGTSGTVTGGSFNVEDAWDYYATTNVQIGAGHTTYFQDGGTSTINCNDDNSTFGSVDFNKPPITAWDIFINSSEASPMRVTGNMTLRNAHTVHFSGDLLITGELINEPGSVIDMNSGSNLVIGGDLTLNGTLDIESGDAAVHGNYDHNSSGDFIMNGGSFLCDHAYSSSRAIYYIDGDFTMSSGIFEICHNHLRFGATATENITGGTIRVGGTFLSYNGNFTPAGGTVELINFSGSGNPYIEVTGGSYLNNLTISGNTSWYIGGAGTSQLYINKDLTINSGTLNGSDDYIYLKDDWINNAGNSGFTAGTGWVYLTGTTPTPEVQQITGQTTFYNLINQNVTAVIEIDGPITVNNNYEAAAGGATCETLVSGSPVNINGQLILPQGYFAMSAAAPVVNVASLDQGGTIQLTGGTLNVGDITEAGIFGTYTLFNGTINLTQDNNSFFDLFGDLYIYGGTMNLIGGSDVSYWPGSGYHVLEMSAGVLDFQDVGIRMRSNNMTYSISGGKIKSAWHIIADEPCSVFDPSGGSMEMCDSGSAQVNLGTGSYFHDLIINKPGYTVTATRNFPVKGELDIQAGTFSTNGYVVTVGP